MHDYLVTGGRVIDGTGAPELRADVGGFNMTDGIMKRAKPLMATTNGRVSGSGEVNFKTGQVDITLVPKAKGPNMFSLATPVLAQAQGNSAPHSGRRRGRLSRRNGASRPMTWNRKAHLR